MDERRRAERSQRPLFLRALGQDLDRELHLLASRMSLGLDELSPELGERREVLERMLEHYCNALMPPTRALEGLELSRCVREVMAGLSAERPLRLHVQCESVVAAERRPPLSLLELAIRPLASFDPEIVAQATAF